MLWMRIDATVADSPKIGALGRELRISRDSALALVIRWWGWVAMHRPDGNLAEVGAEDVADGARWRGDPGRLLAALQTSRLLDPDCRVHGWHDINGRALADAERKRQYRRQLRMFPEKTSADASEDVQDECPTRYDTRRDVQQDLTDAAEQPAAPAPEPVKKPKKAPAGPHAELIAYWVERFKTKTGHAYPFAGGKDGTLVAALLRQYPIADLKAWMDRYLTFDDDWTRRTGFSLGMFKARLAEIISKPKSNQQIAEEIDARIAAGEDIENAIQPH